MRVFRTFGRIEDGTRFEEEGVDIWARYERVTCRWTCRGCGVSCSWDKEFGRRTPWAEVKARTAAWRCEWCSAIEGDPRFLEGLKAKIADLSDRQTRIIAGMSGLGLNPPRSLSVQALRETSLLVVGDYVPTIGIVLTQHEAGVAQGLALLFGTKVIEIAACIERHKIGGYLKVPVPFITTEWWRAEIPAAIGRLRDDLAKCQLVEVGRHQMASTGATGFGRV